MNSPWMPEGGSGAGSAEVTQPGTEDDALGIDALFMIKYGAQVVKRSAVAAARLK